MLKHLKTVFSLALLLCVVASANADEPTAKQKRTVKSIASTIDRAGRLYKSKKYETSAEKIEQAMVQIKQLASTADADLMKLIEPEHARLAKAHKLLTDNGQTLTALADLPAPMVAGENVISFTEQVAPILVSNCGRCHVRGNRGNFSAANYTALMNSAMVAEGIPADSRIVQVIQDKEMPPNGNVADADLNVLKQWIRQGAKFDGDNPTQGLGMLANIPADPQQPRLEVAAATGRETVSFGLHVAPVLLSACGDCHIDTNRVRGNFSMASFQQLLRGGDSGNPLEPGNSRNSVIIKRLRGIESDVMPPSGKLDDKIINTIATWIDEGAKFDGGENPGMETRLVAATAKAASQSHKELVGERSKLAQKNWKLIMSDVPNQSVATDNFLVVGATMKERLEEIGKMAEKMAPKIQSALKVGSKDPYVKGNATIFVFERRYDFNELGVMLKGRQLPKTAQGFWEYTTVDAFASVLLTRNRQPETVQAVLAQQLAAIRVANMAPDVPRWFSEGVGYWAAAKVLSRNDEVGTWDERAIQAAASMQSPGDFANGNMPEDQAALASYLFIKELRNDSSKFAKLFRFMKEGYTFSRSFMETFGQTPDQFFGKTGNRRRNRNR